MPSFVSFESAAAWASPGLDLGLVRNERLRGLHELIRRDALLRRDRDRVEAASFLKGLSGRNVEDGNRGAAQRIYGTELPMPVISYCSTRPSAATPTVSPTT